MNCTEVVDATIRALRRAETSLPPWVVELIEQALRSETNTVARFHLSSMLENASVSRSRSLPICQDTGLPIFFIEVGREIQFSFDLKDAVSEAVKKATKEIPLRPNVVDPLTRKNTQDNTGNGIPDVIFSYMDGCELRITAFPKGAGSENMSFVGMLNPADDPFQFILESVAERAANACPPLFLGIGIGGSFDKAARMAKRALLNMPGTSDLELDLLRRINNLGIGPMALGGRTTALGIKIEKASCHTASLPIAINFQCWAHRYATEVLI